MTSFSDDPNLPVNRFPWNRKGTAIRLALEQFLRVAEYQTTHSNVAPYSKATALRIIADLRTMLDQSPRELDAIRQGDATAQK